SIPLTNIKTKPQSTSPFPVSALRFPALIEPLEARIAPAAVASINLADLTGKNGFKLSGVADNDQSGFSVKTAGDINGDGFADLIIGAPSAAGVPGGTNRGASYV